jgi:hypothetical protein
MTECRCMTPPFHYLDYLTRDLGEDRTNGRFGEVTIETCRSCGAEWLRYFMEDPLFSRSGRWFRGLVPPHVIPAVTPENALAILASLPWHFYGGSYFETTGKRSNGPGSIPAA